MQLVIHPDAQAEIIEAADWYDGQSPGLGDELVGELESAFDAILRQPQKWAIMAGHQRR